MPATIVANDDTGTPVNGYTGGTAVANVLVNDLLNGVAVDPSDITLSQVSSTNPGISLVGGSVVVAAGTPAGTYSLTYQICEILNPTNCDQATVSVTVNAATIVANDDTGTPVNGYAGGTAVADVLVNDLLNGVAVNPSEITLSQVSSTNAGISLVGGSVVVAAGTPAGTYSLTYQICEILNPTNCDQATVSVTVNAASIVANDDTGTPVNGYAGGTAVANVLVNDLLNGVAVNPSDITLSQVSSTNAGISLVGGSVVVAAGTPAGTYSLTYQICEILNPTNCDQATVSVTVNAATIVANDDTGTPINGYAGGTAVANVLVNDLLNGVAVNPSDITLSQVSSTNAGISLVGGSVVVAAGTPAGTYSLTYQICEILNPTNCDQATVSVTVNAATIVANDDTGTPINGYAGGTAVADVLVNDLLNGVAVNPSDITLSQVSSTNAGISLVGGSVVVAAGTPAGTYSLTYQICEILNPTNCDQATVSVTVNAATIVANDDTGTPVNGYAGGTAVANVLVNDLLNGVAVNPSDITLSQVSSTNAGISLVGGSVVVAAGTPAGTYSLTYQICEILNPTNCDQATVSVTVNAATIVANDDTGTPVNGYAGGTAVANVLVNDLLNGVAVNPSDITLSQVSSTNAGISLVGGSVVVAAGTPAGTYSLTYQICEILNPTNCDQATVSVTVNAATIVANDDTGTPINGYAGGTAVADVLVNDLLNGVAVNPSEITLSQVSSTNAGISLVGGSVVVAAGTPAGTYSLTYQICEILNPTNCDQATVSVTVNAATIVANDDTGTPVNGYAGGTAVANVLVNDLLNGVAVNPSDITLSQVSSTNAGISLVGSSVVVAAGTPAGTYSLTYQICEILNPTNCDQATVSVTVNAATIVANDDTGTPVNGYAGGTAVADVLVNDLLNGVAVNPSEITLSQVSSTNAGISLVGGSVVVAAGTPAGTYSLTYQICEILNPTNCDQATVSVTVTAPSLEANVDAGSITGCEGGIAVNNVLSNDLLNGTAVIPADVILSVITPASDPGIVLNPATGAVTVANGTQAGNYSIVYQICEVLNPTICDQSTVTITIVDNELPTIACPPVVNTVTDAGLCTASGVSLGTAITTDNCQVSSLTNNAPSTYPVGSTTVTWTVMDASGQTATCDQLVIVTDNQPPSIICPANITVQANSGQTFASGVELGIPVTSDNCGIASTVNNSPTQFPLGITWVTWTVTDINGLSDTCHQSVLVTDNQLPVILCPPTITISCITELPPAYSTYTEFVNAGGSASDNDGINPATFSLESETSNNQSCPETISRVYKIADNSNNYSSCTQVIIIDDEINPTLVVPAAVIVSCSDVPDVGTATASDNCDTNPLVTYLGETRVDGDCAGEYTLTRTWTATDACGNTSSASQTINVQDISAPVIVMLPSTMTIDCPATPEFATATATDECGSAFTLTYEDVTTPGICAGAYSVTRTWTATDACGNISSACQTINVQDISAPVIASLPAPTTIDCPATPEFATATATDECGSAFTLTYEDATTPGICAGAYSVTRTWTATDACGNISSASQTINVQDISAPVIASLPAPTTIDCPATPEFATATATDECGSAFTLTYEDATTPGICAGAYSVTRTWTATDACGNISSASQTINVQDISAPVIASLPAPTTIDCPATPEFATATATDECGSAFTLTYEDATTPGICAGAYSVTRTWTATDACGNISSASQTINVQDISAPVIASLPAPTTIDCPATPEFATATATDECGSAFTLTYEDTTVPGICAGAYSVTRTWTATDACGNISSASQTINVQDISAPVIASLPAPTTIDCPATPEFATATATDECGSAFTLTYEDNTTPGICAGAYSVTRTWTATDACGNISSASQTINVQDISAPVIGTLPSTTTIDCPATPEFATATATDECGSAFTLTYEDSTVPGICAGAYSVTRTWTATDACGNISSASQTINVQDISAPVIASLPAPTTIDCPATPEFATATATDECGSVFTLTFEDATVPGICAGAYSVTRTWTATDACGNISSASQTINVQDISAPVIASLPARQPSIARQHRNLQPLQLPMNAVLLSH
ncbi:MAG: HYR domain-containing protein [Bacteroidales bacterium]|nr:HYR domain-containing protein [Bacteroidales bacterium]